MDRQNLSANMSEQGVHVYSPYLKVGPLLRKADYLTAMKPRTQGSRWMDEQTDRSSFPTLNKFYQNWVAEEVSGRK